MKQLFDHMADSYDAWYDTAAGRFVDRVEREAVLSYLEPQAGISVLDIGCGTGNFSLSLARAGAEVTGMDISPAMLAEAVAKADAEGLKVEFVQGDAMPGRLLGARAVLFTPPDFDYSLEQEAGALEAAAASAGRTDGGFLCAVAGK